MVKIPLKAGPLERSYLCSREAYMRTGVNLPEFINLSRQLNVWHGENIRIIGDALQDVYNSAVQEFWLKSLQNMKDTTLLHNHLRLKLEGVTRCAFHFQQKKRYIHSYLSGSLTEKGTACIKRDTMPLLKIMEENVIRLAMRGWYLIRRDAKCLAAISPRDLETEMTRENVSLFVPGTGWTRRIEGIERFNAGNELFGTVVNLTGTRWIKITDEMGDCLDYLEGPEEKWNRCLTVAEYIVGSLNNLAFGEFCVSHLMESCLSEDRASRELYGIEPAPLDYRVPFVRVIGNSPPFQNKYQDPLVAIRERLQIDMPHYLRLASKMFVGEDSSTIPGIMAISSGDPERANKFVRQLKERVDGILSGPIHYRPVKEGPVPVCIPEQWASRFQLKELDILACKNSCIQMPRGFSLVGSVWGQEGTSICHYYAKSDCIHEPEVLNVAQQIAFQRGEKTYSRRYGDSGGQEKTCIVSSIVEVENFEG